MYAGLSHSTDGDEVELARTRGLLQHEILQKAGQSPKELVRLPNLGEKFVPHMFWNDKLV
jgi:hypothetical protein